ncbi:hypothetical protein PIROE2DRAFT_11677 [Piromyces sp. E2]|nr:hypothetical protein PIROE2DRAFT_11677 [Piromyces sp. E2]|eukprot:OUM62125.1 hypothetical protein PIROE2DRAFT_11677 [Piromyces sp. E2]
MLSECVLNKSSDKGYIAGVQTSHCKRKGWVLPTLCFTGVFIAIIIGLILFHFRKEQMEPVLRPATYYQPKNKFFNSKIYNKHSPFKYLSYNASMKHSGSLSGKNFRKNYHNLEIPVNYMNANNNNNNRYSVQDLDPTTYPEYDNTVEIIDGNMASMDMSHINDMSHMNGMNRMSMNGMSMNGMNMNGMSMNGMNMNGMNNMNMSQVNSIKINDDYTGIPEHILEEAMEPTLTSSMTETETETEIIRPNRKNDYSIESATQDFYSDTEISNSRYNHSFYNTNPQNNFSNVAPPPPPSSIHNNSMLNMNNSYNPYSQQQNILPNDGDPPLNQSYILNNPSLNMEESFVNEPTNNNIINNTTSFINNTNNNNYSNVYPPYNTSYIDMQNNNSMRPNRHTRNYSLNTSLNPREEMENRLQKNRIHRRSYSYNDNMSEYYKRNSTTTTNNNNHNNYNEYNPYPDGITSQTIRTFIEKSKSNPQSQTRINTPYSYHSNSQNPMIDNPMNNSSYLRKSPSPILQEQSHYPSNPPSYIPNHVDNSFSVTNTTTTGTTETTTTTITDTTTTDDDLTTDTSTTTTTTTTEYSIYRRKNLNANDSTYRNSYQNSQRISPGANSYYIATSHDNGFYKSRYRNGSQSNIMAPPEYENPYPSPQPLSYNNTLRNSPSNHSLNRPNESIHNINPSSSSFKRSMLRPNNSVNTINPSLSNRTMVPPNTNSINTMNSPHSRSSLNNGIYRPSTQVSHHASYNTNYRSQMTTPSYNEGVANRSRTYYPSTVY